MLMFTDLADMLAKPLDRETYESGYRSGYRDGWIACIEALARALPAEAYEVAFNFWENELRAWLFHEPGTEYLPPELAVSVVRAAGRKSRKSIPPSLRFTVLQRDGSRCQLCGITPQDGPYVRLEVDHKLAESKGGKATLENLWTLCADCNRGKGVKNLET